LQTLQEDQNEKHTSCQLGVMSSSSRYKEDIQDMSDASRGLMQLRPVTFCYQKPFEDRSKPVQYGLPKRSPKSIPTWSPAPPMARSKP
jgi:hypothetical protein